MKSGENDRKKGGHVGSIILHTVTGLSLIHISEPTRH